MRPVPDRADDFLGAVVPARAFETPTPSAKADLDNVILFVPRRRAGERPAPAISLDVGERPAPQATVVHRRWKSALLVAGSLAVHSGLLAAFLHEPTPHASIGLQVLSVELVLGAREAAGLAKAPSQSEADVTSLPSPKEDKPEAPQPDIARREIEKPATQPIEAEQAKPEQPAAVQALPAEIPPEPQEQPELAADPKPAEKPVAATALPVERPDIKEPRKPKPEPKQAVSRARDNGKDKRDRAAPASNLSVASNSIGRGRSDSHTNYRGLVAAHLARHKQFPAAARSHGDQGTATVTFSLDGGGRVTSVRLARGSGIASIDRETQAMVRRASPFPAPPSGRPQSFTVPVQFYLR